ncbi:MAG: tetratricopeptide repeat protein, partial [Planctomycetota bacterium]
VVREGDSDLAREIRALTESVSALEARVAIAENGPRSTAAIDPDALQAAVAAYLEGRTVEASTISADDVASMELGSAEDIVELLANAGSIESTELWKRIVAEGLVDEVLAVYAAAAEANANDPEAQLALGEAYLGVTQEAGASPLAGKYATLADQALDRALDLDPQHWDARFTKATALSFWPPIFGKQAAAIQQFEILVDQQKGMTPNPYHANTHLLLGNMYQQTGQMDKALQAWNSGLEMYPGNSDLAAQIALASGSGGGY